MAFSSAASWRCYVVACLTVLGACTAMSSVDPAASGQSVTLVNSLSWTDPVTGKRDGSRTAWPLAGQARVAETYPLAQVRECASASLCRWGVLKVQRSIRHVRYLPGGVGLTLELMLDAERSHRVAEPGLDAAISLPADVPALAFKRTLTRELTLPYGQADQIDLGYGVAFSICVARRDSARQEVDTCAVPFL